MKITIPETKCFSCKDGWTGPGTIQASIPELQQLGVHRCPYCKGKGKFEAYDVEILDDKVLITDSVK